MKFLLDLKKSLNHSVPFESGRFTDKMIYSPQSGRDDTYNKAVN